MRLWSCRTQESALLPVVDPPRTALAARPPLVGLARLAVLEPGVTTLSLARRAAEHHQSQWGGGAGHPRLSGRSPLSWAGRSEGGAVVAWDMAGSTGWLPVRRARGVTCGA